MVDSEGGVGLKNLSKRVLVRDPGPEGRRGILGWGEVDGLMGERDFEVCWRGWWRGGRGVEVWKL
jgi:hypothetical protein